MANLPDQGTPIPPRCPPESHGSSNPCLPCGGTQHQHGIVPFPALPISRSRSATYSPRPHHAGPCYTDPTSAEALGKPRNPALEGVSQCREHPGLQSRPCGHPSPCSPAPAPAALPAACPTGTEQAGAGRSRQDRARPNISSALGFLKVPSQVPYHIFVTKSTFVASPIHQTQRTPSPTCLQVPAEPGWARPSPRWHCLIPPVFLCWPLYLWITKAPKPS